MKLPVKFFEAIWRHPRGPEVFNYIAAFANIAAGLSLNSGWVAPINLVIGGWSLACAINIVALTAPAKEGHA